ncbi:bifunctional heptose 7-phosphate kinase/heptose 1-phosphate adenyltransferase [Herpetosiphon giganteus]|uniref:bifunctional heptose 7-phosphate kinase/heptose 1-phosphate adenyltransferase n=1 Tax=Herpetosiphon giganteus TaxID=2029754 RepID=UPI00195B877C|nr:bifunctional ADP-heptose synthase [Herpetosiphon giganteus]MBM7842291.1 rfaE bifunctional protein kinase chain/domain [Herpetosiphon giganteus]
MITLEHVAQLANRRILVVGDVVLDEYLYGKPERLSREAAIPVLEFEQRRTIPGGAANPAANITALGSTAGIVALIGADQAGQELANALHKRKVSTDGLLRDEQRPTTTKTRILASVQLTVAQQVARLDKVDRRPVDPDLEDQAIELLGQLIPQVDAVLCSDYRVGWLSERLIQHIQQLCQQYQVLLTVDSQGRFEPYAGADFLKCNLGEAEAWLGQQLRDDQQVEQGLQRLRDQLKLAAVVITRGGAGFSLLDPAGIHHIPAVPIGEVFDATGAGDTFIATATLSLCAGHSPLIAAQLANTAAALVVRRIGVATVSPNELQSALIQFGQIA